MNNMFIENCAAHTLSAAQLLEFVDWCLEYYKYIDKNTYILKTHKRQEDNLPYYLTGAELLALWRSKETQTNKNDL